MHSNHQITQSAERNKGQGALLEWCGQKSEGMIECAIERQFHGWRTRLRSVSEAVLWIRRVRGHAGINTARYRASHVLVDLGWVD